MKKCRVCKETKPLTEFNTNKARSDGYQTDCRKCRSLYNKKHYLKNKDKYKESSTRNRPARYIIHGLTEETYIQLLGKYDGRCHLCQVALVEVIDHDHDCCPGKQSCGKCVRGLLCTRCNTGIGRFKDDTTILQKAIEYLTTTKQAPSARQS